MEWKMFFSAFVAFLALVNPVQKLFVVFSLQNNYSPKELKWIVTKASITALIVLIIFLLLGDIILGYIFNMELYAFQVTCGVVLFYNGFLGLQKGAFLTIDANTKISDIMVVPIAVPMIAGPATITAVVTMPASYGRWVTISAVVLALAINLLLMRYGSKLANALVKLNILMPMIRITGLIVAAIGTQMIFNGVTSFIASL